MSVSLLLKDSAKDDQRLVPVATQSIFVANWLPGAEALKLDWVALMETGFDVTAENRDDVVAQLGTLHGWMVERGAPYDVERLDRLVREFCIERIDRLLLICGARGQSTSNLCALLER